VEDDRINDVLSSWTDNIKVDRTDKTNTLVFLDMTFWLEDHNTHWSIAFKTFRNELNIYNYQPRGLEHRTSVYKSNVHTECMRYIRTNKSEADYKATLHFS